jgi:hypothetical protein
MGWDGMGWYRCRRLDEGLKEKNSQRQPLMDAWQNKCRLGIILSHLFPIYIKPKVYLQSFMTTDLAPSPFDKRSRSWIRRKVPPVRSKIKSATLKTLRVPRIRVGAGVGACTGSGASPSSATTLSVMSNTSSA